MLINKNTVKCFTEHNVFDDNTNTNYLFQSNPSYRSDTGQQLNSVWCGVVLFYVALEDKKYHAS